MKINNPLHLFFVICVIASTYGFSQTNKIRQQSLPLVTYNSNVNAPLTAKELSQINEVYGDKTQEDVLNHPQRVKDIKNILRNRVVIKLDESGTMKSCPLLSEVSLFNLYVPDLTRDKSFNPREFNPLKYNFNFYGLGALMYKVDNTNYYIIIKSQHQ